MTHYVCKGECGGMAENPASCAAKECSKYGHPMDECSCEDRKHSETTEDKKPEGPETEK